VLAGLEASPPSSPPELLLLPAGFEASPPALLLLPAGFEASSPALLVLAEAFPPLSPAELPLAVLEASPPSSPLPPALEPLGEPPSSALPGLPTAVAFAPPLDPLPFDPPPFELPDESVERLLEEACERDPTAPGAAAWPEPQLASASVRTMFENRNGAVTLMNLPAREWVARRRSVARPRRCRSASRRRPIVCHGGPSRKLSRRARTRCAPKNCVAARRKTASLGAFSEDAIGARAKTLLTGCVGFRHVFAIKVRQSCQTAE
jgi:hypothetical protein